MRVIDVRGLVMQRVVSIGRFSVWRIGTAQYWVCWPGHGFVFNRFGIHTVS